MKSLRYGLCGLLVFGLIGCSSGGSGKPRVAFVTNNPEEFWKLVEAGCKEQAAKDGVELDFKRPQNATAAEQQEIIDALTAKGAKAISISVQDPKNMTAYLDKVADRGVALLAVDNDAPKSKRKWYIGTNNVQAGRAVGTLIKEAKPEGAVLALFVGQIEPDNARERIQGVLEELGFEPGAMQSKDGKYRLYAKDAFTDEGKASIALDRANAVIAKLGEREGDVCLVGLWAYNPPALLKAAVQQGVAGKYVIVGFDEDLDTLKGIDDGHIYGTVVQNPFEFGRKSVEVMAKYAKGEKVEPPLNGIHHIPERIVTKTGDVKTGRLKASEYAKTIRELLGK